MFLVTDRYVLAMAILRFCSGMVEFTAACLMLKFGQAGAALRWNTLPAVVGPTVLLLVTVIGVAGLSGKISLFRVALITTGVLLIMVGTQNLSSS